MIIDGDDVTLSSGRHFCANNGIIGISPELIISEGYDGGVDYNEDFTLQERIELADYMITLWTQFKEKETYD